MFHPNYGTNKHQINDTQFAADQITVKVPIPILFLIQLRMKAFKEVLVG